MTPVFRLLTFADLDDLVAIEKRCFSQPWSRGQLDESVRLHHSTGLWNPLLQTLMGYAFCMNVLEEVHLLNLVIDLPWQGQGWGRHLLKSVQQSAQHQGAHSLLLEVRASNEAARHLYLNNQFEIIGIRRGYYATDHPKCREDALVMRRKLFPVTGT